MMARLAPKRQMGEPDDKRLPSPTLIVNAFSRSRKRMVVEALRRQLDSAEIFSRRQRFL